MGARSTPKNYPTASVLELKNCRLIFLNSTPKESTVMVFSKIEKTRIAIAEKLVEMQTVQTLIISNEEDFLAECDNPQICDRFSQMLKEDRTNIKIIEKTIQHYGIQIQPRQKIQKLVRLTLELMRNEKVFYEKLSQHELLKHGQIICGLIINKAARIVGTEVEKNLVPIKQVHFENLAHQEQLKQVIELLGVAAIVEPFAESMAIGRPGGLTLPFNRSSFGNSVQPLFFTKETIQAALRKDYQKLRNLITEIQVSNDPQKMRDYFGQLNQHLLAQNQAQNQVIYAQIHPFFKANEFQSFQTYQFAQQSLIEEMQKLSPMSLEFQSKLWQIKANLDHQLQQDHCIVFDVIDSHFSYQQQEQMATQFHAAKQRWQNQV